MDRRLARDTFSEIVDGYDITYITNEFDINEIPARVDVICQVGIDGYITGNIQIDNGKVYIGIDNVTIEDAITLFGPISNKLKSLRDKYLI